LDEEEEGAEEAAVTVDADKGEDVVVEGEIGAEGGDEGGSGVA
jgi:hypothetical protein